MIGKLLNKYKSTKVQSILKNFDQNIYSSRTLIPIKINEPIIPFGNSIRFSKNQYLNDILTNQKEEGESFAAFYQDTKQNKTVNIGVECKINILFTTGEISILSKEQDKRLYLPNVKECEFNGEPYQLYDLKDNFEMNKALDYEIAKNLLNDINKTIFPILEIIPSVPYDFNLAKDVSSINAFLHNLIRNNNDFLLKMFSSMFDENYPENSEKFQKLIYKNYQELLKITKILKKNYSFNDIEEFLSTDDVIQRCKILIDHLYEIGDYIVKEINMHQEHKKDYMQKNEKLFYRFIKKRLDKILSKDNYENYKGKIEELFKNEEINTSAKRAMEVELNQAFPPVNIENDIFESFDERKKTSIIEDILNYPWDKRDLIEFDIKHAHDVLEKNLYGMNTVKERIYEYIAKLKRLNAGNKKGFVILVTGPPGTGKTTIATLIGKALKRKVGIINLSGNSDPMILKGCKRTYVDAQPSIFYKEMVKLGVKNPVIVLDEIDKLSVEGHRGNPADSLLEILNPEENHNFVDHYLNVPLDFSETIFICTSNYKYNILEPLLDRIEVLEIDPYTLEEKKKIIENFVLPNTLKEYGFEKDNILQITNEVLEKIIKDYSYFAGGIRGIKNNIDKLIRKANFYLLKNLSIKELIIDTEKLENFLKNAKIEDDNKLNLIKNKNEPGYINTAYRDEIEKLIILPKFSNFHPKFTYEDLYTKHILKQVNLIAKTEKHVEESLKLAVYCVQDKIFDLLTNGTIMNQNIYQNFLKSYNVYLTRPYHSKQGNTFGLAFYVGFISAALNMKLLYPRMMIVGELTPQGYILKIHHLSNILNKCEFLEINEVMIPEGNRDEYNQFVKRSKKNFNVFFVRHVEDVVKIVFPSLNVKMIGQEDILNKIKHDNLI